MCGKPDTTHHAERIVTESDVRVQRCTDSSLFQIVQPVKRIYQFTETCFVQAHCHGIDREIAPVLVILQGAVLYYRLAAVMAVRLFTGTDKFHFRVMVFNLCRTEVFKNRNVCPTSQLPAEGLCHFNSAPYYDYIYILRGTLQEYISYITSYNVTFQSQIGRASCRERV